MAKVIKIPSVFVYETKVVGVSKDNADDTSRQQIIHEEVAEGDRLSLRKEPGNPFDPHAIQVLSSKGNQIGYLNKKLAEEISIALDSDAEVHVVATWVNGKEILGVGLRIEFVN
ncbi:MAG: hypothetical protein HRT61_05915 [Ekhidna sp.]|nr:hypothetical protein [Ekhidna sp.]